MKSGLILPNMPMPLPVARQRPPRPALSVLYFPGYPPMGSTIYDFSNAFVDSGILTNEELDTSEVDITVSPDATTAISVGSTIRIDSEQMLVSATGATLTVTRGYNGTTPATHVTTSTINRKTTNHGTITGATWVRSNRGIWGLSFDGTDDVVSVASAASLTGLFGTPGGTILAWVNPDTDGETDFGAIVAKTGNWALRVREEVAGFVKLRFALNRDGTSGVWSTDNAVVPIGTPSLVAVTYNDAAVGNDPVIYVNGVSVAITETVEPTGAVTADAGNALTWGDRSISDAAYDGKIWLGLAIKGAAWSAAQHLIWYNQTRRLFGV